MRYVIIGNSAAGLFAAEGIRQYDADGQIDIVTNESYPAYARCLTSEYLTGNYQDSDLYLRGDDFYQKNRWHCHFNTTCTAINSADQTIETADGRQLAYDKLLIASGAHAVRPAIDGRELPGVYTLRTLDDAKGIAALAAAGREAVVLGGGFVSLKAAYALLKRGLKVTCVVTSHHLFGQVLASEDGDILADHLTAHGLNILYGNDAAACVAGNNGRVNRVVLRDGRELPADVVVIGKGVRPNIDFLAASGIRTDQAIVTDRYLRTNLENIYAAGDCIESYDVVAQSQRLNTLWPNATEQGHIAGQNMTGQQIPYLGSLAMNAATFFGRVIIGAGLAKQGEDQGYEVVQWSSGTATRRLVFDGDVLVGYFLMDDVAKAGILTQLMKTRTHLGKARRQLERGDFSALLRFIK